jgi:Ca2+-binding EF-hand superfamily protein
MTRKYLLVGLFAAGGFVASPARADNKGDFFKMMDTNGDGKISAEEHAAGSKKMFEKMDADKNGKVTAAEMEASHEKMTGKKAGQTEMTTADKIKMVDTNGDGEVTLEEYETGAKTTFDKMDTDHDGFVSKAEAEAGHKMMKKGK